MGEDLKSQRGSAAAATERIRRNILDGVYAPGSRLKEEDLARELQTSRTPIREALGVLRAEGLLVFVPNRGVNVSEFTAENLDERYRLRALLEGHAAARAATRISAEQLLQMEQSLKRIVEFNAIADYSPAVRENFHFHDLILAAAGSPLLNKMHVQIVSVPSVFRSYYWYDEKQRAISQQFHQWLLDALRAADAERAQRVAVEHVLHARDVLLEHLSSGESSTTE